MHIQYPGLLLLVAVKCTEYIYDMYVSCGWSLWDWCWNWDYGLITLICQVINLYRPCVSVLSIGTTTTHQQRLHIKGSQVKWCSERIKKCSLIYNIIVISFLLAVGGNSRSFFFITRSKKNKKNFQNHRTLLLLKLVSSDSHLQENAFHFF